MDAADADAAEGLDALDARFLRTLAEVQRAYRRRLPARELQVRVERWCARLALEGANDAWRRERNAYARLLLRAVAAGELAAPFDRLPREGELPRLAPHELLSLRPRAQPAQREQQQQQQQLQLQPRRPAMAPSWRRAAEQHWAPVVADFTARSHSAASAAARPQEGCGDDDDDGGGGGAGAGEEAPEGAATSGAFAARRWQWRHGGCFGERAPRTATAGTVGGGGGGGGGGGAAASAAGVENVVAPKVGGSGGGGGGGTYHGRAAERAVSSASSVVSSVAAARSLTGSLHAPAAELSRQERDSSFLLRSLRPCERALEPEDGAADASRSSAGSLRGVRFHAQTPTPAPASTLRTPGPAPNPVAPASAAAASRRPRAEPPAADAASPRLGSAKLPPPAPLPPLPPQQTAPADAPGVTAAALARALIESQRRADALERALGAHAERLARAQRVAREAREARAEAERCARAQEAEAKELHARLERASLAVDEAAAAIVELKAEHAREIDEITMALGPPQRRKDGEGRNAAASALALAVARERLRRRTGRRTAEADGGGDAAASPDSTLSSLGGSPASSRGAADVAPLPRRAAAAEARRPAAAHPETPPASLAPALALKTTTAPVAEAASRRPPAPTRAARPILRGAARLAAVPPLPTLPRQAHAAAAAAAASFAEEASSFAGQLAGTEQQLSESDASLWRALAAAEQS